MPSVITTGKTIDIAINDALSQLGKELDEVDVEIISEGGLFKKAQVKVSFEEKPVKTAVAAPEPQKAAEPAVERKEAKNEAAPQKAEPAQKLKKEKTAEAAKPETKTATKEQPKKPAPTPVKEGELVDTTIISSFLEGLLKAADTEAEVQLEEQDERIKVNISGQNLSKIIGVGGETLGALQYITSIIAGRAGLHDKRVFLDAGGYKASKDQKIRNLAYSKAKQVLETEKSERLNFMTSYERRIVHDVINEFPELETISKGDEPRRFVIIRKKEK